ncbi:MAG: DUF4926 domain-containing protein [Balneolaceae bacterium]
MLNEYAVVVATKDLSEGVKQGCVGTIVMIYDNPSLAYEVEFFDVIGDTIELLTVEPDDIKLKAE